MTTFNIDSAVEYLISHSHPYSTKYCAKYVADALNAGNLQFNRQPSAYLYHTNGTLLNLGFKQISKPINPQKGDIYVQNKTKSHIHGHIAMYSGQQWISDFRQNSDQVYSSDAGEIYYYRYDNNRNKRLENEDYQKVKNGDNKINFSNKKSTTEIAKEVINGLWGYGEERKMKLENEGYNYKEIQNEVNRILSN